MTLCIGWIRKTKQSEEIWLAADSTFTGGQNFLAAPKIFPLNRGDCALACAGSTSYSFPIVEHIVRAMDLNRKLAERACDFTDIVHTIIDIANKCLHEEQETQHTQGEGPDFSFILAGYSWKIQKAIIKVVAYNKKNKLMEAHKSGSIKGSSVSVIGDKDQISQVKKKIFDYLERDDVKNGEAIDIQPLEVLMDYINDNSIRSIGGRPQMVKIYPFMRILPIGFRMTKNGEQEISYFGRPLLKYETFPYPIYDIETKKFMYMKNNSECFILQPEEISQLHKFI